MCAPWPAKQQAHESPGQQNSRLRGAVERHDPHTMCYMPGMPVLRGPGGATSRQGQLQVFLPSGRMLACCLLPVATHHPAAEAASTWRATAPCHLPPLQSLLASATAAHRQRLIGHLSLLGCRLSASTREWIGDGMGGRAVRPAAQAATAATLPRCSHASAVGEWGR